MEEDVSFEMGWIGGSCMALFLLRSMEDISQVKPEFPEILIDSLIALADKLATIAIVPGYENNNNNKFGRHHRTVSPTISILENKF